ncbi:MAG: sugar phosphate isomerase/epimerase [Candidatus Thermoplasmatota archaeon]|nr:sugar phosphate isomerase/epimerase [Candidatus Thermoplasmatota archaeon]
MEGRRKRFSLGYSYAPRSAALGGEDRFIELMRNVGADHVEVILEDIALAKRITMKGFSVSFHCPGWWDTWGKGEDVATEWLLSLLRPMSQLECSTQIAFVWHAAMAPPESVTRSTLFSDSASFFKLVRRLTVETLDNADICLENLTHGASKTRIGDTPEELIELRRAIGHDDVRFCFDIGHYIMGLRTLPERTIPGEFLENVAIVHLHGVEGKDRPREKWWDHYCLKENSVPWENHLQALLDTGWRGTIVLEAWRDLEEEPSIARRQIGETFQVAWKFLEGAT